MLAYGNIWVMAPSDSYHNLIQTHIAFTFYFSLPFWLVTANSRLKFYLNESIFVQRKNITLCHFLNSSHYCVGSVASLGQVPGTQFVKFQGQHNSRFCMVKTLLSGQNYGFSDRLEVKKNLSCIYAMLLPQSTHVSQWKQTSLILCSYS